MPTSNDDDTALEVLRKLVQLELQAQEAHQSSSPAEVVRISGARVRCSDPERQIPLLRRLRALLWDEEWARLAELTKRIKDGLPVTLDSDRIRAEKSESDRIRAENAQRLAEERDRQARERDRQARERDRQARERDRQKQEQLAAIEARKILALHQLEVLFESDFLAADYRSLSFQDAELITEESYWERRIRFIRSWAQRELDLVLDADQARTVATTEGNVRVQARAGAGKTRTLVTRALFLQRHCRVPPRSMLLLAFNNKAAKEMKGRLSEVLGDDLPHVMTFHALAHALVQPEETLIKDDRDTDQLGQSREIQTVIDEQVQSPTHGGTIRELMLAHFRADWDRIQTGGFDLSIEEFLAHRRALQSESLNCDYVKSFGEKVIANALFEHGVPYKYERSFRWSGVNYRPDFTIETGERTGVAIEYFGLSGDPDYDEQADAKRDFWNGYEGWTLVEFKPSDLRHPNGEEGFVELLRSRLDELGVPSDRLSEEEIWSLVKDRAIDKFTTAMTGFIGRCRKLNLSPDELREKIGRHSSSSKAEQLFLKAAVLVHSSYLALLDEAQKEDFDGLIWRATELVQGGQTCFRRDGGNERGDLASIRFLMIDEFQDFSEMFFSLIKATRLASPDLGMFCVGDNWQAINAFAGSDLSFFNEFENLFEDVSLRTMTTNYRSGKEIVRVSNALMEGLGPASVPDRSEPGSVRVCLLDEFEPTATEVATHNWDEFTPAVLRLVTRLIKQGKSPVLLSRMNSVPWPVNYRTGVGRAHNLDLFLEHLQSFLPEDDRKQVSISTTHKYKGLEQEAVIVIDALDFRYPLIHPNWVFQRIFGDSLDKLTAEEHRLFYVAMTRAVDTLLICTDRTRESLFLEELRNRYSLAKLKWTEVPPAPSIAGALVEVRVSEAYPVRDLLKDRYTWIPAGKYWSRTVLEDGFDPQNLLREPWYSEAVRTEVAVRIEVYREDGELVWSSG